MLPARRIRRAAGLNCAPLAWDGTEDDLPAGWDQQVIRTFAQADAGVTPNTLGATQIVVRKDRHGQGLAGVMVNAMQALAREQGFTALAACVRPTAKDKDPFAGIDEYAFRTRELRYLRGRGHARGIQDRRTVRVLPRPSRP